MKWITHKKMLNDSLNDIYYYRLASCYFPHLFVAGKKSIDDIFLLITDTFTIFSNYWEHFILVFVMFNGQTLQQRGQLVESCDTADGRENRECHTSLAEAVDSGRRASAVHDLHTAMLCCNSAGVLWQFSLPPPSLTLPLLPPILPYFRTISPPPPLPQAFPHNLRHLSSTVSFGSPPPTVPPLYPPPH